MAAIQTIPDPQDEPAWAAIAAWLGDTAWERTAHGLKVDTGAGRRAAFPGDLLYRDADGHVAIMFAGNLERAHAPPDAPEAWALTITLAHSHGDATQSLATIMSLPDGRIDARALAREVESFVGAATRPRDIAVALELKPKTPRGQHIMPSLEELKARPGQVIEVKPLE